MSDTDTEVTSRREVGHPPGRFVAAVFGFLLFPVAIGALVWNESRAVDALRGLSRMAKDVTEVNPTPIDPAADQKLVHLSGALVAGAALRDPTLGLTRGGMIHLKRTVEMYQWKEREDRGSSSSVGSSETARKTYSYSKRWSEAPVDSRRFKDQARHDNPPMPIRTAVMTARDATLGDRTLAPALLDALDAYEPLPPPTIAPDGYTRVGDLLYQGGSPASPQIGDIRVTFGGVPSQPVSVLAAQEGTTLTPFRAAGGDGLGLVMAGAKDADEMVTRNRARARTLVWALRGVGFATVVLSLLLILSPLAALGKVVPFAAALTRDSRLVVAIGLAIPLTLVTIALSWIAFRPLFGGGLLVAAGLSIVAYRRLRPQPPGYEVAHPPSGWHHTGAASSSGR